MEAILKELRAYFLHWFRLPAIIVFIGGAIFGTPPILGRFVPPIEYQIQWYTEQVYIFIPQYYIISAVTAFLTAVAVILTICHFILWSEQHETNESETKT